MSLKSSRDAEGIVVLPSQSSRLPVGVYRWIGYLVCVHGAM